jgi:hypothetical protein
MKVKQYVAPLYNLFRKGPLTSVCINSNTSIDLDLARFGTLYLDFDRVHRLQVKVDRQSTIRYLAS